MNEDKAAVAFRNMIRATLGLTTPGLSDSLRNINTDPLPDGATCYVIENQTVYRLRKSLTTAASGTSVIAPAAGPGRWVRASVDEVGGAEPFFMYTTGATVFPAVDTNWTEPNNSTFTLVEGEVGNSWTLGTLAQLTYNGPTGVRYMLQLDATLNSTDGAGESITAGISVNADLAGAVSGGPQGAGEVFANVATGVFGRITVERMVTLATGDVIQPRIKSSGAATVTGGSITMTGRTV